MADIVTAAEVKTALRITETTFDSEIGQLIDRIEARLQDDCQRRFKKATFTSELYSGDGTPYLVLRHYPLRALTSAAIENEGAITVADASVIRYDIGAEADGLLELQARAWTLAKRNNVMVTYDAGFEVASIKTEAPGIWDLILDATVHLWQDMVNRRRGVQSQSSMDGSITYFDPVLSISKDFKSIRWDPIVNRYRRRRSLVTSTAKEEWTVGW
jgi:hypothetical protein